MNSRELQDAQRRLEKGKPLKPRQAFEIWIGGVAIVLLAGGALGFIAYAVIKKLGWL